jgi:radical SAM superfamily enzyme YgiQ (UPF0313 family)
MRARVLLVNPPVYDFTAFDFWARPYGLLRVAGPLRKSAELRLFDFMDRLHPAMEREGRALRQSPYGRGAYRSVEIGRPRAISEVPRPYRRFGLARDVFRRFLDAHGPWDAVLVQTGMTYWYPGVREVIEDVRRRWPRTRIVLGGVYATLCPGHAAALEADLVVSGSQLAQLRAFLGTDWIDDAAPYWEGYPRLETGVVKLTEGCPYRCTYCSVPQIYPGFRTRVPQALRELALLRRLGVKRTALYDDALLCQPERVLLPFLEGCRSAGLMGEFHTPNALHARGVTTDVARALVGAGFRSFFLGFESRSADWQAGTGGKVCAADLAGAVGHLRAAGARASQITAYLLLGHPDSPTQELEASMRYVHSLGARIMLAEFSPIPGTPDGDSCGQWVDMDEPLWHNKTAFPLRLLGEASVVAAKALCRKLNQAL